MASDESKTEQAGLGSVEGDALDLDVADAATKALSDIVATMSQIQQVKEAMAELTRDNERLRKDNVRLAKAMVEKTGGGRDAVHVLRAAQEKVRIAQQQVRDLIEENTELSGRILELEELNGSMMSMYISSFQLHATLDLDEVIRTIQEIVVNFIGAKAYAILTADEDGTYRVVAESGLEGRLPKVGIEPRGVLAEVIGSRVAYIHTSQRPAREGVLAAVPLSIGKTCVGAVMIYSLLSQKEQLFRHDVELLGLLGGHAATALVSARLYARADRKLKTLEGMIALLGSAE